MADNAGRALIVLHLDGTKYPSSVDVRITLGDGLNKFTLEEDLTLESFCKFGVDLSLLPVGSRLRMDISYEISYFSSFFNEDEVNSFVEVTGCQVLRLPKRTYRSVMRSSSSARRNSG